LPNAINSILGDFDKGLAKIVILIQGESGKTEV
jgi:hypothetical protein